MSNLLKKYYVTNISTDARVIDSNKKAEEVIKERAARKFQPLSFTGEASDSYDFDEFLDGDEGSEDGFVAGLDVVEVDPSQYIQADEIQNVQSAIQTEEILEEARLQAAAIIEEAEQKAAEILSKAEAEAAESKEEAKKLGYEEGASEKMAEVMKMQEDMESELQQNIARLEEEYLVKADELESDIVEAIIKVFNKVFHIQFDDKKEMLLHLVRNVVMNVEVGKEFRIRVSQNNYKFINSHLDDLRINIGNDVSIEVVNDAHIGPEDCQIETSFGVFDCGIDMELNNLIKDIKSLCC